MAITINSFTPNTSPVTAPEQTTVTFEVSATESDGVALLYQWETSTDWNSTSQTGTWSAISGATTATYTTPQLTPADDAKLFRVRVYTLSPNQQVYSPSVNGLELNVVPPTIILITNPLETQYSVAAGSTLTMVVQSTLSGENASTSSTAITGISYQWQKKEAGSTTYNDVSAGGLIAITTETVLDQLTPSITQYYRRSTLVYSGVPFSENLDEYRVIVTSSIGSNSPLTSTSATIIVGATLSIQKQPGVVAGFDGLVYTPPGLPTTKPGAYDDNAIIIYKWNPADVYAVTPSATYFPGRTILSVNASSTAGSFSTLSYLWQYQTVDGNWQDITVSGLGIFNAYNYNTNAITFTEIAFVDYLKFRCIISGTANEAQLTSVEVAIYIWQRIVMSSDPVPITVAEGQTADFIAQVDTTVYATQGIVNTKWQRKNPGSSTWNDVTSYQNNAQPIYTTPVLNSQNDNGAYYRLQVDGQNCTNEPFFSPTQNGVLLSVYSFVSVTTQPSTSYVYNNQIASFALSATSTNNASLSYQWQVRAANQATWSNLSNSGIYTGVNTNILLINPATIALNNYRYRCVVDAPGTISSVTSDEAYLYVLVDNFTSISSLNDQYLVQGQALQYTANAQSASLAAVSYQWQVKYSSTSVAPTILGQDITISSTQSYTISGTSYPVRGVLWVPTGLSASSIDVVVCYHPTISDSATTILQSANNMMSIMKNNVGIKDKIIFCVAYPQDAVTVAQNINLLTAAELSNFKFGDNLPYARAALLWAKNNLNGFMSSNGITKTINKVFMFGHSQGGSLVHKLNTLEQTNGAIANAPGPIRLDLTCSAVEAVSGTNTTCNKLFTAYGTANSTPLTSNQYYQRSMQPYVTGHQAPITYLQALDDSTGNIPGNPNSGQPYYMTQLNAAMTANAQPYTYISLNHNGSAADNHAAFITNNIFKEAIKTVVESTIDWINISGATNAVFTIPSVSAANSGYYRYRAISFGGVVAYSNTAIVSVTPLNINVVSNNPSTVIVLEGAQNTLTLSVTATPSINSDLTYEWQFNTNPTGNTGWSPFSIGFGGSSPASNIYTPLAFSRSQTGLRVRCAVVGTGIPGTWYSGEIIITVNRRLTYVPIPVTIAIAPNEFQTIDLASVYTGGTISYQWQYRTSSSGTWTNISGYTTQALNIIGYSASQLPTAGSFVVNTGMQIRCLVTLTDATQYQFFTSLTGLSTNIISPAGSEIIVNKNASPDLTSTVSLIPVESLNVQYSVQSAKTGAAIGSIMCIPKKANYSDPGPTGGDDCMAWNVPHPLVQTLNNTEKLKYDLRFVGWLPLTASPLMSSTNNNNGALLSAAEFPELARIMGNTFGGSINVSTSTAGFLPPKTGANGNSGGLGGTFGLPLVYGKKLMGTGAVNNNAASVAVVTRFDPIGGSGSLNAVGYLGGAYNYYESEQLPVQSGGTAGTSTINPSTFTLGNYTTAGWGDAQADIQTTYSETLNYSVGPLSTRTFTTTTVHSHNMTSYTQVKPDLGQKIGRWSAVGQNNACREFLADSGEQVAGVPYIGTTVGHTHGITTGDASAEGIGHNADTGGLPSTFAGQVNQSETGSFLTNGALTMSQQSNSLWNSALSFTLQNADKMRINTPHFRLKYYIKTW